MAQWTKERDSCSRCQDLQLLILLREGGLWHGADAGVKGRVAVLGSSSMFDDAWLGHYNSTALLDWLLTWLQQVHDTCNVQRTCYTAQYGAARMWHALLAVLR